LRYPNGAFSKKKWTEAKTVFSDRREFANIALSEPVIRARDKKGRSIFARLEGQYILFMIGRISLPEATTELDRVAEKLRALPQKR
jgi:hypothetical protein